MTARPPTRAAEAEPPIDLEDEDEEGVKPGEMLALVRHAPRRHRRLAWGVGVVVAVLGLAAAVWMPRTYISETRILAQKNLILPALGNPNRQVPREESPTRNVSETILSHDNLVALVKQANLVDRWDAQRPPILRLKDKVTSFFAKPDSEEEKLQQMVGTLEKRLHVQHDDQSVDISVEWTNPEMAFQLASLVEKNFLDARHAAEVAVISDAIAILDGHANEEHEEIDTALSELERLREEKTKQAQAAAAPPPPAPGQPQTRRIVVTTPAASAGDSELTQLLEEKRRKIHELQDARQRRLADLKSQLADLRSTLAPAHPSIIAMEAKIEAASEEPPELTGLKNEERALLVQIAQANEARPTTTTRVVVAPSPGAAPAPAPAPAASQGPQEDDAATALAKAKLSSATHKYDDFMARIESARIELDTARAAFKYRYVVVRAPEMPKAAKKPSAPLLALGGLIGGVGLGLLAAIAADILGGRFVEAWQVRRKLKIPLLGEVAPP